MFALQTRCIAASLTARRFDVSALRTRVLFFVLVRISSVDQRGEAYGKSEQDAEDYVAHDNGSVRGEAQEVRADEEKRRAEEEVRNRRETIQNQPLEVVPVGALGRREEALSQLDYLIYTSEPSSAFDRVEKAEFVKEVVEPMNNSSKRVMIVAHGALNAALMCYLEGNTKDNFWGKGLQRNCQATVFDFDGKKWTRK